MKADALNKQKNFAILLSCPKRSDDTSSKIKTIDSCIATGFFTHKKLFFKYSEQFENKVMEMRNKQLEKSQIINNIN